MPLVVENLSATGTWWTRLEANNFLLPTIFLILLLQHCVIRIFSNFIWSDKDYEVWIK